jgi:hypothetical protein
VFKQITAIESIIRLIDREFLLGISNLYVESTPCTFGFFERINGDTGAPRAEMREVLPVRAADIEYRFLVEPECRYDMGERF